MANNPELIADDMDKEEDRDDEGLRGTFSRILASLRDPTTEDLNLRGLNLTYFLGHIDEFIEAAELSQADKAGYCNINRIEMIHGYRDLDLSAEWIRFLRFANTAFPCLKTFFCITHPVIYIQDVLVHCPKVCKLTIHGWRHRHDMDTFYTALHRNQMISKLELQRFDISEATVQWLLSLPHLQELVFCFTAFSFRVSGHSWLTLFAKPSLRKIGYKHIYVSHYEFQVITQGLQNAQMTFLDLSYLVSIHQASAASVARSLGTNNVLTEVSFGIQHGMDESFYESLAFALLVNQTLEKLMLNDSFITEEKANLLAGVVMAVQHSKSLKSLAVDSDGFQYEEYPFTPLLGAAFCQLLQNNKCLQSLRINVTKVTAEAWHSMMNALRTNASLKTLELFIKMDRFSFEIEILGEALTAALEDNASLEEIVMDLQSDSSLPDSFMVSLAVKVASRTRLQRLRFGKSLPTEEIPGEDLTLLHKALSENYYLEELGIPVAKHHEKAFGIILCLNGAGRRYLIEDTASKSKGVEVLISVKDDVDVDCLYYHLRENPGLCNLRSGDAASPPRG